MIRRDRLLALTVLVFAALAAMPLRARADGPVPVQLASIPIGIVTAGGQNSQGYVSIYVEVPTNDDVGQLCSLLPKVNDAISLTFQGHPVHSTDGIYDLTSHAERLRKQMNAEFGRTIATQVFLRQGLRPMVTGVKRRPVQGTTRGCRALKVLPWEAHMPKADHFVPKPQIIGRAVIIGQPQPVVKKKPGLLDKLLSPVGLFFLVATVGFLMLVASAGWWFFARWRRERRRRERRRRKDRRQGDRRSGVDRRRGKGGYTGPERRSGKDRREGERRAGDRRTGERRGSGGQDGDGQDDGDAEG